MRRSEDDVGIAIPVDIPGGADRVAIIRAALAALSRPGRA
jgi:hypothetical protein